MSTLDVISYMYYYKLPMLLVVSDSKERVDVVTDVEVISIAFVSI